jgi:membrane dipeptidase
MCSGCNIWPYASSPAAVGQLIADVDYVRCLVGTDHVGIGTDMAGLYSSCPSYREWAPLPAGLLANGFSEADTRRVLGENFLCLLEAVTDA